MRYKNKKSQLNAISRSYCEKRAKERMQKIINAGLEKEYQAYYKIAHGTENTKIYNFCKINKL